MNNNYKKDLIDFRRKGVKLMNLELQKLDLKMEFKKIENVILEVIDKESDKLVKFQGYNQLSKAENNDYLCIHLKDWTKMNFWLIIEKKNNKIISEHWSRKQKHNYSKLNWLDNIASTLTGINFEKVLVDLRKSIKTTPTQTKSEDEIKKITEELNKKNHKRFQNIAKKTNNQIKLENTKKDEYLNEEKSNNESTGQ